MVRSFRRLRGVFLNGLNDNHYRIELSTLFLLIYKKVKFAYTWASNGTEQGAMSKPQLDVAIAILLHQDKVLVGWREAKQHQGNKHEFPGGKVEAGRNTLSSLFAEKSLKRSASEFKSWHAFDYIQHEYDDHCGEITFISCGGANAAAK